MALSNYTPKCKAKLILEVSQGGRALVEIAAEGNANPNMLRNRKKGLYQADRTFDESRQAGKACEKKGTMENST